MDIIYNKVVWLIIMKLDKPLNQILNKFFAIVVNYTIQKCIGIAKEQVIAGRKYQIISKVMNNQYYVLIDVKIVLMKEIYIMDRKECAK